MPEGLAMDARAAEARSDASVDPYPTRLPEARPTFPRQDPVIHSRGDERWRGPLGEDALSRFERDGFIWFEGFFSKERMRPFFEEIDALAADPALLEEDRAITDPDTGELRSVFGMHDESELFNRLTRDPRILGMARQLLGGDVYIHQSRINAKSGFEGRGFEWHSDFETWHAEDGMPRMRAVSASVLLTHNSEFNGPLMLVPGSHQHFVPCVGETPDDNWKSSLKRQRFGVPDRESLARLVEAGGIEAPKGRPGSLLLFECNTLHASNRNMSPWPRANLFFVYNSVENAPVAPYCGNAPRPEFLATRGKIEARTIDDGFRPLRSFAT